MMKNKAIILIFFLFIFLLYVCNIDSIPSSVILVGDESFNFNTLLGIKISSQKESVINTWKSDYGLENNYNVSLFGTIPVKEVSVTSIPDIKVVPLGNLIGLRLYTNGVLVVGMSEINDENNVPIKPYENSNIKEGDRIIEINSKKIDSINSLKTVLNSSDGNDIDIKLISHKDGSVYTSTISPVKSDDEYKIGLWVKDCATGVGTVSFYIPETGQFAALGHGIIDNDTGSLIDINTGEMVTSKFIGINKGTIGKPGEIKGSIANGNFIGNVEANSNFGIFGNIANLDLFKNGNNDLFDISRRDEIEVGDAYILCDLDGNGPKKYNIKIDNINQKNNLDNKSFEISVNDNELIEKSGGIICGMSGSPIIQNGKFVGVVTNVLVSNPLKGYGIFADLMIKEMMVGSKE